MGCSCMSKTESSNKKALERNRGGVQVGGAGTGENLNRQEMSQMRAAAMEQKRKESENKGLSRDGQIGKVIFLSA